MPKQKKEVKPIGLALEPPKYVGYSDCLLQTPVTVRVDNRDGESHEFRITLSDDSGLLIPYEGNCVAPFESRVGHVASGVFSPVFLVENKEVRTVSVTASAYMDGKEIAADSRSLTVLPFDWWEGLGGNPERLPAFVRPRLSDCRRILEEAGKRLRKWTSAADVYGYTGADKNAVRMTSAAVFAAIKALDVEREPCDLTRPVRAFSEDLVRSRRGSVLQLALFAAACLEGAKLNPVIAVGQRSVGVGVWLYDSCFLDTVTDDGEIVSKYISDGINNLSFFDADDLFADKSVNFTTAEKHFAQSVSDFEYFIDVKRCRMAGIPVLPLREYGLKGLELIGHEEMSAESAPAPLHEFKSVGVEGKLTKNKLWERRLLDLTNRNTLLNFTERGTLKVRSDDADGLYARLLASDGMKLVAGGSGGAITAAERQLLELEQQKNLLRVSAAKGEELADAARLLQRKNREADEESGAKILYLALGFLEYVSKEDAKPKRAPLVLVPADVVRAKGNEDFSVRIEGEYFVNSTLLEYLKQEFNIDVRGLGGDVSALKMSEIFAMVLAETAGMKGWRVIKEAYIAVFSFRRYLMWNDLHAHFDELKQNAVVSALLANRMEKQVYVSPEEEDEGDPCGTLIPLPADSSQYSAVALSRAGVSFVLHGPPGTGKSQTITNIIANALEDGKRVLFVAEKKAALDVVKKRLDSVGVGDFCLELHSGKTDRADAVKKLGDTLALKETEEGGDFAARAAEITALTKELKAPMLALHQKRRLGISVYEGILLYLKNKDAPDVLDIGSAFYDTLSEQKLAECKNRILSAAAAAKECGGVMNSPFENVNLTEYSQALRDKIYCACEVLIAEIRHLKAFLGLFLEFYRQRLSSITRKKLENLCTLARNFSADGYAKYFSSVSEEEFYVFYHSNRLLDERFHFYNGHFKAFVDLGKDYAEIKQALANGGYRRCKAAVSAAKRLSRVALHPLTEEDTAKFLQTLVDIRDAMERIKSVPLSKNFVDRSGEIVFKKRSEYLSGLYALHDLCSSTFLDYDPDTLNSMCLRAQSGYTQPVLDGYLKAAESFFRALDSFLTVTRADRSKLPEEDLLDEFSSKASALIDNVDMLPNWCMYKRTEEELGSLGCSFVTEALESGKLTTENILSGFEKNVYKNFLEINIPADPELSRMTVGSLEDTVEKFRLAWENFTRDTREKIRGDLISRLPAEDGEGSLSVEAASFRRLVKSNLRGVGLRGLFAEIPNLLGVIAPCMLMSPATVAQYLRPQADLFDLVIFDEASQMTTAEAVGAIARAKSAIVVGDPRQLPPTAFFRTGYVDEENLENEDLESILDDCLALGMPERHLIWHYRSKHESLIAFSNSMYYDNRLCTFPSPDADSKVRLVLTDGAYDRGFTKCNKKEGEALVSEVVRRLKDPALRRSSMGVVTFSSAQQNFIERLLQKTIVKEKLEGYAYDGEEPLFVKNLENVQGDERDVILFSVCYGPDPTGRLSLNFGPLNQAGGWRRLNVAVSRAREEMIVFSSMSSGMIDLAKTSSKGVAGLKAFLEFAEKGRTTLAVKSAAVKEGAGVGKYLARELEDYGYRCRVDVGASDFKIDVAVLDPKNPHEYLLAVLFDGSEKFSVKDRNILQVQTLKRTNWNVIRVNCVNYYNNPKREVKRVKELLDRLTGAEQKGGSSLTKYLKPYRAVKTGGAEPASFFLSGENDKAVAARLKEIVAQEEPISRAFLKTRCLATFGIAKSGVRLSAKLDALIDGCAFRRERVNGVDYFYKTDRAVGFWRFRTDESGLRGEEDFTPFEIVALIKALLEEKVSVYLDELGGILASYCRVRATEKFTAFLAGCIAFGEQKGILVRSVSDRITLA